MPVVALFEDLEDCLYIGNCGHDKYYVRMQWMMPQQEKLDDFVIATGFQYSLRQFNKWSVKEHGIALLFEGQGVEEVAIVEKIEGEKCPALQVGQTITLIDPRYFHPTVVETLLGDPTNANQQLGCVPQIPAQEMCAEMVVNDLAKAKKHVLLKFHSYQVNVNVE